MQKFEKFKKSMVDHRFELGRATAAIETKNQLQTLRNMF